MNKEGWQIKTLGDIADVKGGKRVPKGYKLQSVPTKYPYITVSDFTDEGTIDTSDLRYVSREVFEQIKRYTISSNDLYLSIAGTIGKTGYVPIELDGASLTENACKLVLRPGIDRNFVYYFTKSDGFTTQAGTNTRTAAQPKLALERLKTIKLPIPLSFPEQQRIVGVLDEAFAGLATAQANAEKNLQNARALFESHLQSVFTQRGKSWVAIQLADVCERLHQGLNTAGEKVKFYDSGYPIIQTRNIDDGVIELDSKMKFMCEEDWQLFRDKYRPEVGDVFFTNIGTIGKTAIVTVDLNYLIHWNIFKLRPRLEKITSEFLRYTLEQLTLSGYFEKLQKGGTVDFVTKKMISEALIYRPSTAEQKRIVATLDSLREETQRLEFLYQHKLAALATLKKSLLHQAFTGNL